MELFHRLQDFSLVSRTCSMMMIWLQLLVISMAVIGSSQAAGTRTTFAGNRLPDIVPGVPGVDYPVASRVPATLRFRCDQQDYPGFFADPETGCQVFHVCRDNKKTSFLCPNGTLYHQRFFVCDWWFNVDCSKSVGLYPLNKDVIQRHAQQPQDHRLEGSTQPQVAAERGSSSPYFQEPTPTPSFARFDKREVAEPTFHEWASRHIPLSKPSDTANFKTTRAGTDWVPGSRPRAADVTVPFYEASFKSLGSSSGPDVSRDPWATTVTSPSSKIEASSGYGRDNLKSKDEYPISTSLLPDKWLLLAQDPDFLNNIAWGAQLHILNKTRGSGYLRTKQNNRKPITQQELESHPFQGFRTNPTSKSLTNDRSSIRIEPNSYQDRQPERHPQPEWQSERQPERKPERQPERQQLERQRQPERQPERPTPPFVPSSLLSQSKEQQEQEEKKGDYWTPFPSKTNSITPTSTTTSRPVQLPVSPVQYSNAPIRPVQQKTTYPAPPKPTATTIYTTTKQQPKLSSSTPYRTTATKTTVYVKKPWVTTPAGYSYGNTKAKQLKKQQYYYSTSSAVGAASSPAYQATAYQTAAYPTEIYPTAAYQVVLTGGSDYQVTSVQTRRPPPPTARSPVLTTRPQPLPSSSLRTTPLLVQPQRLVPQSILLPLEPHPFTNQQLPYSNQRSRQQQQQPVTRPQQTVRPQQPLPTQAAPPVIIPLQNSRSDIFRPSELEKMSIPMRPSMLLSSTGPSSSSAFEFEPTHREWEPSVKPTASSSTNDYTAASTNNNNHFETFPPTPQRDGNHITNIIRGKLIPANVFPTEPTDSASSSNNDIRSIVVRPRNPITMASSSAQ